MSHPLPLTGERTLPGIPGEEYWFARHEAAYEWLCTTYVEQLVGGVVVEAGSGEGYGADRLRAVGARSVLALEYDEPTVAHVARAYPALASVRANLAHLPVRPGSVDLLVSLQVVEHLWDLRAFLRDCAAALRPDGALVVSTPNRPVFSPGLGRGERPTNPFHVEEFDAGQLVDLLTSAGLGEVTVHGLHHGARIDAWEARHGGIVARQVEAALGAAPDPDLDAFVATVRAEDFLVAGADGAQDLLATAVAP